MKKLASRSVRREQNERRQVEVKQSKGLLPWFRTREPESKINMAGPFAIELERERIERLCRRHTLFRLVGDEPQSFRVLQMRYAPATVQRLIVEYGKRLETVLNESAPQNRENGGSALVEDDQSFLLRNRDTGELVARVDHVTAARRTTKSRANAIAPASPLNSNNCESLEMEAARRSGVKPVQLDVEVYQSRPHTVSTTAPEKNTSRRRPRR